MAVKQTAGPETVPWGCCEYPGWGKALAWRRTGYPLLLKPIK